MLEGKAKDPTAEAILTEEEHVVEKHAQQKVKRVKQIARKGKNIEPVTHKMKRKIDFRS